MTGVSWCVSGAHRSSSGSAVASGVGDILSSEISYSNASFHLSIKSTDQEWRCMK